MADTRASSPAFSASKKHQPNAHPYPIKTTSSALLSWSNSSPHSVQSVKHHYVPLSPTRARREHSSREVGNTTGNTVPRPPPLPTPPPYFSGSPTRSSFTSTEAFVTPKRKRAETLPPGTTHPLMNIDNDSILNGDLPSNPEQWTTEQLLTHLSMSLNAGKDLKTSSVDVMLNWVRKRGLTGRQWLRLTYTDVIRWVCTTLSPSPCHTQKDFEFFSTSLSDTQRSRLLENSRTLRTNVLRAHIGGPSDETTDSSKAIHIRNRSTAKSSPFHGDLYGMSVSSVDLSLHSRMDFSNPSSPSVTIHPSNSVSESFVQRYSDLARIRTRRRGKVKGLVETWEQERSRRGSISSSGTSGGEGSVFGSDPECDGDPKQFETLQDGVSAPLHEEGLLPSADTTVIASSPPRSYSSIDDDHEPSMEELLPYFGPIGVRGWEADIGLGETVKRVPASSAYSSNTSLVKFLNSDDAMQEPDYTRSLKWDVERKFDMGERNAMVHKRVFTAVFTDTSKSSLDTDASSPVDPINADVDILENDLVAGVEANDALPSLHVARSESTEQLGIIRSLETSLMHTRAELQIFKARLEVLEADLTRLETVPSTWKCPVIREQASRKDVQVSTDDASSTVQTNGVADIKDLWLDWRDATRSLCASVKSSVYPFIWPVIYRYHLKLPKHREERLALLRATGLPVLRISSVIMFSFFCAAVVRRVGLTLWLRKR